MTGVQSSDQDIDVNQAGGQLTYLDQALWKRFNEAADIAEFASAWLTLQCSMLPDVRSGVVVLRLPGEVSYSPVASWPDTSTTPAMLGAAAESALSAGKGVVNKSETSAYAAFPIVIDNEQYGVTAVELAPQDDTALRGVMRGLQWGCGWLEVNLRRQSDQTKGSFSTTDASLAVQLAALALEALHFQEAATAVVTELATRFSCERVSLGIHDGKHCKVIALSHSSQFGKQSNLTRAITTAMEEAIDQNSMILYPQPEDRQIKVDRAHQELARVGGGRTICTIPLVHGEDFFGAMTLDSAYDEGFTPEQVASLERVSAFLGPVLAMQQLEDRWIGRKIYDAFITQLNKVFGPGYAGRKLILLLLAGILGFFIFAKDVYRIRADATLEGAIERVTVAPIDGYIAEANVRAGDKVSKDDLLFRIDDRDLRLEYLKWSSQKEQIERKLRDALAQHERSEVNVLRAQLDQAEAQLTLIGEQISRTRVTAPFDGVVVSGDLSDQLGAPVERGQVIFEIAPLNQYRVALQVSENDISSVKPGQEGEIVLASMPDQTIPIQINTITPVSNIAEGRNTFRVDADLSKVHDYLRPGMQGAARIEVDERRLIWIWTHDLFDWLRLWVWSWWP